MIEALRQWEVTIAEAADRLGLEPGPIDWRMVEADRIYELAATGMPGIMRHWTHGRDYWIQRSRLARGQGRLYEMIVHADPPLAYLLEGNTLPAQKLVMAHCLGHAEIFRHHDLFRHRPTDAPTRLAAQERRREAYAHQYGPDAVEWVLDRAYALDEQVGVARRDVPSQRPGESLDPFADLFPVSRKPAPLRPPRYALPTRDLLGFLGRESPVLADWERDLVLSVRHEARALAPNRQVKMIHEGWASWVQQKICTDPFVELADWEQWEMGVLWSHVAAPSAARLNPYALGWQLLDWLITTHGWHAAREALFTETDASLVRNWLTPEAARACQLYDYAWREGHVGNDPAWIAIRQGAPNSAEAFAQWRNALAEELTRPIPEVWVMEATPQRLILASQTPSVPLDEAWAQATLWAVRDLWGGSVQLIDGETTYDVSAKKGEEA